MTNFKKSSIALFALPFMLTVVNCKEDKKNDSATALLLLFLADQASGNCATITKNTTGTIYTATGSGRPKGECSEATLAKFASTSAAAKTVSDTDSDARITELNKYTECAAASTTQTTNKNAVTAATIDAAANLATSGCTTVGGNGVLGTTSYCKDSASLAALKLLTRYAPISSGQTDMSTNYTGQQSANATRNASTTTPGPYGYTAAALLNLRFFNSAEYALLASTDIAGAWLSGINNACGAKVISSNATLKTLLVHSTSFIAFQGTAITNAERAAVTETITNLLTCTYGSAAVATVTAGTTAGVGLCPTSTAPTIYTSF